jgi:hypothetical protein
MNARRNDKLCVSLYDRTMLILLVFSDNLAGNVAMDGSAPFDVPVHFLIS